MSELASRDLREFASFIELSERTPEEHGQLQLELTAHYRSLFPGAPSIEGLAYKDFFEALADKGIGFLDIATYLRKKLETQYRDLSLKLGVFESDLDAFKSRSVSLDELADRLKQLDERWQDLNTSSSRPVQGL